MPATITGVVFHDLNHNGQYDPGEAGIPGVSVVLYAPAAGGCVAVQSGADGRYSFTVVTAGSYTIYEPVAAPDACPPTAFTQPEGFFHSNGPRKRTVAVTAAQIGGNAVITGQDFSHDAVDAPLPCTTDMIQFVGRPTSWYNIDLVTGRPTRKGPLTPANDVNAIGFSPLDGYVYGYDQTAGELVRVDSGGNLTRLVRPAGLPAGGFNTAAFDADGFFYLYVNDTARYYTVDLRPGSATFLKLVDPRAGYGEQTASFGTALSAPANISDWAYSATDGNLYGVRRDGVLVRVAPTTGQVTALATTAPNPTASFGAVAIDSTGTLYAIANNDGTVYKYTYSGDTAVGVPFSTTFFAPFNDGTICPNAAVLLDYGDAPDQGDNNGPGNYNSLLANNGPRHGLGSPLYLGARVTADPDARQNGDATGDDLPAGIQDDGLALPLVPLSPSAGGYVLPVTVTNETGEDAYLYGWIDFDQDGLFEEGEAAPVVTVPSAAGAQTATLNFPVPAGVPQGSTFLRLRVTRDVLTSIPGEQDSRSVGPASDGEVEDYLLLVAPSADLQVTKSADPPVAMAGAALTYTVTGRNIGPDPAQDTLLTDTVPAGLLSPEFSVDGGATWQSWTGTHSLGVLAAGAGASVLIRGIADPSAAGTITNTAVISSPTYDPDLSNNTDTADTPIQGEADLSVVKVGAPKPARPGQPVTYTLVVANAGPSVAGEATLSDAVPGGLDNVERSLDGGVSWQAWTSPLALGTLAPGEARTILLRGTVAPSAPDTLTNTATVASPTPDPDPSNNTDTDEIAVELSADLTVTKAGAPDPVPAGGVLTYTVEVGNLGPADGRDVRLSDPLPALLSGGEWSADGSVWRPWTGTLALGDVPAGGSRTVFLRGTVSPGATGILSNTVTVSSTTPDPDPDNNQFTELTPVNTAADLSVTKRGAPSPAVHGALLTYTVTLRNSGPDPAVDTVIDDPLPAELLSPESSADGGASWQSWTGRYNAGTVAAGQTVQLLLRGTLSPEAEGVLSNTVTVSSPTPDPDPDNNRFTERTPVDVSADLSVVKTALPARVRAGEMLVYTLTAANAGPSAAQGVALADQLPAQLLSPEFSVDGGATWAPWVSPYAARTLLPGGTLTLVIRGRVSPAATAGKLSNTAVVSSDTPDPDPGNNTDTAEVEVETAADLSVSKQGTSAPAIPGQRFQYDITARNGGPSDAAEVLLTDAAPISLLTPEFSADGGATWAPWSSPYGLGILPAGESRTVQLRGTVSPAAEGTLQNTAVVASATPDPDPSNNTDTDRTPIQPSADLSVLKTGSPAAVRAGDVILYTLVVANAGPAEAQGVRLVDALPAEVTGAELSADGGATWSPWTGALELGAWVAGRTGTYLLRGTVAPGTTGTLSNTATVTSQTPDPDPTNNSATERTPVEALSADLLVVKTGPAGPVRPGGAVTYTIQVTNLGPDTARGVTLDDAAPPELSGLEFSEDGGASWSPWTGSWAAGDLPGNAGRTVLLRGSVSPLARGTLTNTATVSSQTPDPDPGNNTSTSRVAVSGQARLCLAKRALTCARRCRFVVYELTVLNLGPDGAEEVVVTDFLPLELEEQQFSLDGGRSWAPWSGRYALGTLAPGGCFSLLVAGRVGPCACSPLMNTAMVSSATGEPFPGDGTATVVTPVEPCPMPPMPKTRRRTLPC